MFLTKTKLLHFSFQLKEKNRVGTISSMKMRKYPLSFWNEVSLKALVMLNAHFTLCFQQSGCSVRGALGSGTGLCALLSAACWCMLFRGGKVVPRGSLSHLPLSHGEAYKEMAAAGVHLDGGKVLMGD